MKYMGSKARVAKDISQIINKLIIENGITTYIEPFVGGSNMIEHINCQNKYGYDNNEYLIEFWLQIQKGWNPLPVDDEDSDMTKELYQDVKDNPSKYPKHIVALAGFCASYNAKWFGGYAGVVKTKIGTYRNYYDEAVRNVLKQAEHIKDVHYQCLDYQQIEVENALIYCDPPYECATGYKDKFDHAAYWEWVRRMSKKNIVICSEYSAPPDFECIWSKELTTTLDKNSRSKAVEKLYLYKKENKQMELRVNEIAIPEPITFNYEELKQELTEKVSVYETMVYTDENIKEAKTDRANLNKLKKALNDERIRREKEYMQPFNEFKAQINEIIGIIDKPCAVIDKQVKEYEEQQKQKKVAQIDDFMKEIEKELPDDMHIPMNEKWLNASVSMKSIQEEIKAQAEQIKTDLATIENLPEFSFEAAEVYKSTLDLGKAVNEAHRLSEIAKRKAEADRLKTEREAEQARLKAEAEAKAPTVTATVNVGGQTIPVAEIPVNVPDKQWISFRASLTVAEARELKQFFDDRKIEFEAI